MVHFNSFSGIIKEINDYPMFSNGEDSGCYKIMAVDNGNGSIVNFIISPNTYFVGHIIVFAGDYVTGYYDQNAPVPLIYPPQYQALIVVKDDVYANIKVDYFDDQLISSDGQLKLNIAYDTPRFLSNGQPFSGNIANHNLIVIYGPSTRSIPAQTTPYEVIVWCG